MLPLMSRCLLPVLLAWFVAASAAPAVAQATNKASEAARIESDCGLKKGTVVMSGGDILLQPSPDEDFDRVECAVGQLTSARLGKPGFVGNKTDPNAVLKPPLRYIAEGSSAQIADLVKAAQAEKWVISKTATASDGTAIVQFESGRTMTAGQSERLLKRIWKKQFGDIAFGTAPRKVGDPSPFDD